jgi:hypothetical protein
VLAADRQIIWTDPNQRQQNEPATLGVARSSLSRRPSVEGDARRTENALS